MTDRRISEAYFLAVEAIAKAVGVVPLPLGLNVARIGDWTLAVNVSGDPVDFEGVAIQPFAVFGRHEQFIAFLSLGPDDGLFGGYTEDAFIADLAAASNVQ